MNKQNLDHNISASEKSTKHDYMNGGGGGGGVVAVAGEAGHSKSITEQPRPGFPCNK